MTYAQILETRVANEARLMDYFKDVDVPTDRLFKSEIYNARNRKCTALTLNCNNEQEFNYHKTSFFYADKKGGEFFQCNYKFYSLTITIKDNWN